MALPVFRIAAAPSALLDTPPEWSRELLADGELALLPGEHGLDTVAKVAHRLDLISIHVLRAEASAKAQDRTVIAWADAMPLVWIDVTFSDHVRGWANDRGPMTLLVEASSSVPDEERRRISRFVATLGRQSE